MGNGCGCDDVSAMMQNDRMVLIECKYASKVAIWKKGGRSLVTKTRLSFYLVCVASLSCSYGGIGISVELYLHYHVLIRESLIKILFSFYKLQSYHLG